MYFHNTHTRCAGVLLSLLCSWGDKQRIGLTGIQLLDSSLSPITLSHSQLSYSLNHDDGNSKLCNLLDGVTMTTESENMWSGTCAKGEEIKLKISLNEKFNLGGIIIWNYNGDVYTGVSFILILI